MIHALERPHASRFGAPVLNHADDAIFGRTYFGACFSCGFCRDSCCQYGVDVDLDNVARIFAVADELEPRVGLPRDAWFHPDPRPEPDYPTASFLRTRVVDGACVFLNRRGRGCHLHALALAREEPPGLLKPIVSAIFPLTFESGLLKPAIEVTEKDDPLVCLGPGASVYRGVRDELGWYFGPALVEELDALERRVGTR